MSEFVTLSCPSCGGKLQITSDVERFACAHCGKEHLVKRGGGIISIQPLMDGLVKVQAGVDKTASELAIVRLSKEIPALEKDRASKLGEFQAKSGYLLDLPVQIKKARAERLSAILRLGIFAAPTIVLGVLNVGILGESRDPFGFLCWVPFLLVILTQAPRLTSAVREVNSLERKLAQLSVEYPKQKEQFDLEIGAIESDLAKKKQELAEHQARVSA